MSRCWILRPGSAALLALALLVGCSERAKPTAPASGIHVTGGPLATSERGTMATFEVTLATAPSAPVVVYALSEDASEGVLLAPGSAAPAAWITLYFAPSDWSTPQTVTVKGVDDAVNDGDVTYDVRLSVAGSDDPAYAVAPDTTIQVVNHDDDLAAILLSRTSLVVSETGARWDSFDVVLATQPSAVVTVPVTSCDSTEGLLDGGPQWIAPVNQVDLLFTPSNWSTPQRVTVTGQPDFIVDGDQAWAVTVGPATGALEYAALAWQSVAVVTADTDVVGLVLSARTLSLAEGTSASFNVRLGTRPTAPVVVTVTSGDPTVALVAAPGQYGLPAQELRFDATSWDLDQEVEVQGVRDGAVDGTQRAVITVVPTSGDPDYTALPASTVEATVLDADVPGFRFAVPSGFNGFATMEGGRPVIFYFKLAAAPLADVVVPVTSSDPAEGLVFGAASYSFLVTPANWDTWQTVGVVGVDDTIVELGLPHPYTITLGPTRSASQPYDGVAAEAFSFVNYDNDVAPDEGTGAAPLAVTGLLPWPGTVGKGSSWYRVAGFPEGALVGVRDTVDLVRLTVWDESATPVKLCQAPLPTATNGSWACAVRLPAGGAFLVQVDGSATAWGSTFTLDVAPFTFATGLPLATPAGMASWASSSVTLTGVPGPYAGIALTVDIDVAAEPVTQLQVFLAPPGDRAIYQVFSGYTGGPGLGLDRTVFDDAALDGVNSFPPVLPPFAGTYRPAVPFPHPVDANGTWTLWLYGDQVGTLTRWGLAAR